MNSTDEQSPKDGDSGGSTTTAPATAESAPAESSSSPGGSPPASDGGPRGEKTTAPPPVSPGPATSAGGPVADTAASTGDKESATAPEAKPPAGNGPEKAEAASGDRTSGAGQTTKQAPQRGGKQGGRQGSKQGGGNGRPQDRSGSDRQDRGDRRQGGRDQRGRGRRERRDPGPVVQCQGILDVLSGRLRLPAHLGLPAERGGHLRLAVPDPALRAQARRRDRRCRPAAQGHREVQGPAAHRDRQRRRSREARSRPEFERLTPLFPDRAFAARDGGATRRPGSSTSSPHRQGPAGPYRLAAQGGQDHHAEADREQHHQQQPGGEADGAARRRAAGGGHRHGALGAGRGRRLDLRPAVGQPHPGEPSWSWRGRSGWSSTTTTWSSSSTASPAWPGRTT